MTALEGAGVVVTGAGSGIGAALARGFAARGARLVVNDVAEPGCRTVAEEIGGTTVVCDAVSETGVEKLVGAARDALGEIDVYCANAGIGGPASEQTPDAAWERAWDVNVMGHVRAARLLVPAWLERGRGHFVSTVSAAGLLTMLGSASYSVTKHAALAFAEWLAITYGGRGITVQAVCPLGVRTKLLADAGDVGRMLLEPDAIEPSDVADAVLEAVRSEDGRPFLILPHADVARMYANRAANPDRWLDGMRRIQRQLP
jgi:NAD(P)-dependent dehydrogenase (short-subunit alcohol dehydrogenase family)